MKNRNFLQSVADYYTAGTAGRTPLENIVFVLPNKRSAMFLKKYVRDSCRGGVLMMPRFMTSRSFIGSFAHYPEADAGELLFILYDAYRRTMRRRGRIDAVREFDSFIFWGDIMLSDFDDIDRSLVNADELYRNLKNVKEIQADYLDDEQKEVVRRVWGESRLTAGVSEFWMHLQDGEEAPMAAKFVYLWEIMADVYHEFHRILNERHLSSAGAQYRSALDAVKKLGRDELPDDTHYVFVGFNDLTTSETLIFEHLRKLGIASFFWDSAPLQLLAGTSPEAVKPLQRLDSLMKAFPMPDDYEEALPDAVPDVHVTSVPSNIGQSKALYPLLHRWIDEGAVDSDNPLNTAVVLPDQGLLLPTLLSIPEEISKINITMGLPYRTTTFASLLHNIISMQLRARKIRGVTHFFYEDVKEILTHPHIQLLARGQADVLAKVVNDNKLYNISIDELAATAPELSPIFTAVTDLGSARAVADYLTALLAWLTEGLKALDGGAEHSFEIEAADYFRNEIERLVTYVDRYGVAMEEHTFLHLFERLFNARGLTVNGTPLAGLQILGVLETRALDFDNVVILSMNERIFPRNSYTKTMIPTTLRAGFGLPDFDSLEWTYAYCFYRLLARARRVQLYYDSRTDGVNSGERSRYISQMAYLMPGLKVHFDSVSYGSQPDSRMAVEVAKTPEVMKELDRFKAGGPLRLSATALKTYKKCGLRFYLEYVRSMRGSDELVDYMSASDFGTAVHNTIQELYSGNEKCVIDSTVIDSWLKAGTSHVDDAARRQVVSVRYPKNGSDDMELPAEVRLACDLVAGISRANLAAEREYYCADGSSFTFIGNEVKKNEVWQIDSDLGVNFFMSIDRVDRLDGNSYRFIDFKTGQDEYSVSKIEGLFGDDHKKDGIFQLFLYSEAYLAITGRDVRIQPVLHSMRKLTAGAGIEPVTVDKKPVADYREYRAEFQPKIHALIKSIFDPELSFKQCDKDEKCSFCPFLAMCGRFPDRKK